MFRLVCYSYKRCRVDSSPDSQRHIYTSSCELLKVLLEKKVPTTGSRLSMKQYGRKRHVVNASVLLRGQIANLRPKAVMTWGVVFFHKQKSYLHLYALYPTFCAFSKGYQLMCSSKLVGIGRPDFVLWSYEMSNHYYKLRSNSPMVDQSCWIWWKLKGCCAWWGLLGYRLVLLVLLMERTFNPSFVINDTDWRRMEWIGSSWLRKKRGRLLRFWTRSWFRGGPNGL